MASDLLVPTRRGLFKGLGLLLAAPAIVRISSLMPVKALPARDLLEDLANDMYLGSQRELISMNLITREAVRMWKNSNAFLRNIDTQYKETVTLGTPLRIRLPHQKD